MTLTNHGAATAVFSGRAFDKRGREGCARDTRSDPLDPCLQCTLGDLAFCNPLPPDELERLMAIQSSVRFAPPETLFNEGDPALYLLSPVSGTVKTYKLMADGRRQITGFFFRGDLFGFSGNGAYGYTAEAVTPVTLCRFPLVKLEQLFPSAPVLARSVLQRTLAKLANFHEQMLLLGRKSAPEKLASFLISLSMRAQERGDPASPVLIPMGRADVADYLGLTIETVSRTLSKFRVQGLVELPNPSTVTLCDRGTLRAIADGL
ncbi:Crp/Fnr family transcriptional regulator [Rhodospirillum rubrum]|uniref:Crp/Fnr family transcriptional regulator n=1 Tax=Rhodospirillum rubrum TaxID=1085 RepID=UPI0019081D54|nr:helix-turn-helix domain-containing protein [Rhodospirillum rubrum]MBK1666193.1 Crp/Fnr family transcriptional regulator [Rhodospirillum rubrum]MBK1678330.1 Crp/Fnr family transcriptional regulator [Rhodospirillum rubrum]